MAKIRVMNGATGTYAEVDAANEAEALEKLDREMADLISGGNEQPVRLTLVKRKSAAEPQVHLFLEPNIPGKPTRFCSRCEEEISKLDIYNTHCEH